MWSLPQFELSLNEAVKARKVAGVVVVAATADDIVY